MGLLLLIIIIIIMCLPSIGAAERKKGLSLSVSDTMCSERGKAEGT